jgi:hypothetical protein
MLWGIEGLTIADCWSRQELVIEEKVEKKTQRAREPEY